MRVRSLRWLMVFGCAAIALGALGYSVSFAQAVEVIPDAELPEGVKNAGDYAPPGWSGSGEHPGKKMFDSTCGVCHSLSGVAKVGPGLAGLYKRVADSHPGENPYEVVYNFVDTVQSGGEDKYSADPYFRKIQEEVTGPGVQMSNRGNLPATATRRDLLNIIDFIFRFQEVQFVEADYLAQVKLGRELVSGRTSFTYGGPSCTGCHSIGHDRDLRGASVAPNIADAYVTARRLGKDEKNNYSDGLWEILSGESAPAAHFYYKDVEGVTPRRPLTPGELSAVTTFFEQEAREVGTEHDSNFLPIFALLAAALGILILEPSVLNVLFAKEGHEFVDGPYEEDDHGHGDHDDGHHEEAHAEAPKVETAPVAEPGPIVEEKPAEAPAESDAEPKTDDASTDDSGEEKKED